MVTVDCKNFCHKSELKKQLSLRVLLKLLLAYDAHNTISPKNEAALKLYRWISSPASSSSDRKVKAVITEIFSSLSVLNRGTHNEVTPGRLIFPPSSRDRAFLIYVCESKKIRTSHRKEDVLI